jgi:hypothetical protein
MADEHGRPSAARRSSQPFPVTGLMITGSGASPRTSDERYDQAATPTSILQSGGYEHRTDEPRSWVCVSTGPPPLPPGRQSDWYRNIQAAGTCRLRLRGKQLTLSAPALVPVEPARLAGGAPGAGLAALGVPAALADLRGDLGRQLVVAIVCAELTETADRLPSAP